MIEDNFINNNLLNKNDKINLAIEDNYLISWHNLQAELKGKKSILSKCNGQIKQGEFVAIMGPSGAGKSTFMNIISGRQFSNSNINLSGTVLLNNTPMISVDINRISSYVKQQEYLFEYITVGEAVNFSAQLGSTEENKSELSSAIIEEIGLEKSKDTQYGGKQVKGLSGGEQKRSTIAVDLVTHPRILFLDEPTTGLDNQTAEKLIKRLRALNQKSGSTIVFTIHQPNSKIVKSLDRLILILDGNISYDGKANNIKHQFEDTIGQKFPDFTNPIDQMMLLSSRQIHQSKMLDKLNITITKQIKGDPVDAIILNGSQFRNTQVPDDVLNDKSLSKDLKYKRIENGLNSIQELLTVANRTITNDLRMPLISFLKFAQYGVVMLFDWLLYKSLADNASINNQRGFMFQMVTVLTFSSIPIGSFIFTREKNVVITELSNRRYRLIDQVIGKMITLILINTCVFTFFSLLFFVIQVEKQSDINWGVQLRQAISIVIGGLNTVSSGFLLGVLVDNEEIASNMIMPWCVPTIMLTGGLKIVCNMNIVLKYMTQLIPQYQFLSSLQSNIFDSDQVFKDMHISSTQCMIEDQWQSIQVMMGWFLFQWVFAQLILWYKVSKGLQ